MLKEGDEVIYYYGSYYIVTIVTLLPRNLAYIQALDWEATVKQELLHEAGYGYELIHPGKGIKEQPGDWYFTSNRWYRANGDIGQYNSIVGRRSINALLQARTESHSG